MLCCLFFSHAQLLEWTPSSRKQPNHAWMKPTNWSKRLASKRICWFQSRSWLFSLGLNPIKTRLVLVLDLVMPVMTSTLIRLCSLLGSSEYIKVCLQQYSMQIKAHLMTNSVQIVFQTEKKTSAYLWPQYYLLSEQSVTYVDMASLGWCEKLLLFESDKQSDMPEMEKLLFFFMLSFFLFFFLYISQYVK